MNKRKDVTNIENLTSKAKTTTLGISRLLNSMSGWQMRSANSHVCQPQIRTCEEKTFQLFCAEFFESSWRAKWRILSAPSPPDPLREGLYMPDKISQRAESQRVCPNTSLVIFPKTIVTKTGTSNYILDMNIFCSNTQQTISTVTSRLQGWLFCWKCWGSLLSHLNLVPVQRLGPAPLSLQLILYSFHCIFRSSMEKKLWKERMELQRLKSAPTHGNNNGEGWRDQTPAVYSPPCKQSCRVPQHRLENPPVTQEGTECWTARSKTRHPNTRSAHQHPLRCALHPAKGC